MATKLIKVEIDNGELSVDLQGFKGKGCKELIKAFLSGAKITSEGTKPEFYQTQTDGKQQTK